MSYENEALRDYALNVGQNFPEKAWINTPHDTWELNPFYRGPAVPHPESHAPYEPDETLYDPTIDAFID